MPTDEPFKATGGGGTADTADDTADTDNSPSLRDRASRVVGGVRETAGDVRERVRARQEQVRQDVEAARETAQFAREEAEAVVGRADDIRRAGERRLQRAQQRAREIQERATAPVRGARQRAQNVQERVERTEQRAGQAFDRAVPDEPIDAIFQDEFQRDVQEFAEQGRQIRQDIEESTPERTERLLTPGEDPTVEVDGEQQEVVTGQGPLLGSVGTGGAGGAVRGAQAVQRGRQAQALRRGAAAGAGIAGGAFVGSELDVPERIDETIEEIQPTPPVQETDELDVGETQPTDEIPPSPPTRDVSELVPGETQPTSEIPIESQQVVQEPELFEQQDERVTITEEDIVDEPIVQERERELQRERTEELARQEESIRRFEERQERARQRTREAQEQDIGDGIDDVITGGELFGTGVASGSGGVSDDIAPPPLFDEPVDDTGEFGEVGDIGDIGTIDDTGVDTDVTTEPLPMETGQPTDPGFEFPTDTGTDFGGPTETFTGGPGGGGTGGFGRFEPPDLPDLEGEMAEREDEMFDLLEDERFRFDIADPLDVAIDDDDAFGTGGGGGMAGLGDDMMAMNDSLDDDLEELDDLDSGSIGF